MCFSIGNPTYNDVRNVIRDCPNLQRVYVVSAEGFTLKAVERLLKYLEKRLTNLRLLNRFEYRARYYKGKANVPHMVAVMEFK